MEVVCKDYNVVPKFEDFFQNDKNFVDIFDVIEQGNTFEQTLPEL